jgi:hypothetical protein
MQEQSWAKAKQPTQSDKTNLGKPFFGKTITYGIKLALKLHFEVKPCRLLVSKSTKACAAGRWRKSTLHHSGLTLSLSAP